MAADEDTQEKVITLPTSAAEADRSRSTDSHTRDRWAWLDQVLADHELTPLAFPVAYVIAGHVNRETGQAWPSQATIAEKVGGKERGVRAAVEQLASRGHIVVTTPDGRKGGNRYRLIIHRGADVIDFHRHGGAGETHLHRHGGAHESPVHRHGGAGKDEFHRHDGAGLTGMAMPIIPMNETSEDRSIPQAQEPKAKPRRTRIKSANHGFVEAYELYPRHDGPDAAERAYAAAIGRGASPEEILAAVRLYAAKRSGQDEKFTAMMSTWLNAGRWKDGHPAKAGTAVAPTGAVFEVKGRRVPEENIVAAIERWQRGEPWHDVWGPPPDSPGCRIPRPILERAGVAL